jgi:hypothetical protein
MPGAPAPDGRTRLYVATDGDDAGPGTESRPLRTISRAARLARPGTTVIVGPGRYQESVRSVTSGSATARIVFTSQTLWGAQLLAPGADTTWRNDGDYVEILNFDITGAGSSGLQNGGSHVLLERNRVHDAVAGTCIMTWNDGYTLHDIDIVGNVVFGCGRTSLDHGIYLAYRRGLIADNVVYDNSGFGLHCWHACTELTISNNLSFANGGGIVVGQGDSPDFGRTAADHMIVSNNIVVDNRDTGIAESGATGPSNRFLNNIVFGNGGTRPVSLRGGTESGTITADPRFVDYRPDGSGDYRLADGSPGIDRGTEVGAPASAIDGMHRPVGRGTDIGPYER